MMKLTSTPREDQLVTGFKSSEPTSPVLVSDSVDHNKMPTYSLRPFQSSSALYPDSTNNNQQSFCSMPWRVTGNWASLLYQVLLLKAWLDSTEMETPRFGSMKISVWITQPISLSKLLSMKLTSWTASLTLWAQSLTLVKISGTDWEAAEQSRTLWLLLEQTVEFQAIFWQPTEWTWADWASKILQYWTQTSWFNQLQHSYQHQSKQAQLWVTLQFISHQPKQCTQDSWTQRWTSFTITELQKN